MPTYRMYAVSIMAVNKNDDLPADANDQKFVYWAHRGAVCLAENIDEAGRQAKEHVYKAFAESEGYSMHSVVVSPIESEFFDAMQVAIDSGMFLVGAEPPEGVRTFNFDPSVTGVQSDPSHGQSH